MRSESNGHSFANGNGASNSQGAGGFEYDMNTGRPEVEVHWWLLV